MGGDKDVKTAMEIFTRLAKENHIQGMYFLALANLYGNEFTQKNPQTATKLLLRIEAAGEPINHHDKIFYLQSFNLLGHLFEKGFGNIKPNLGQAVQYYNQSYYFNGQLHIARLILTGKIAGDREQAKKIFEEQASTSKFAAYLYGTFLISEGEQERGIALLEKATQHTEETSPLSYLQLAIAYHSGFGVDQDEDKAQEYFKKISDDPDDRYRSLFLARGYMNLFGIGVKQNVKKGFALIDEAENKIDDVFFATDQLFPAIKKLKTERAEADLRLLLEEEETAKKKKGKNQYKPQAKKNETQELIESPFNVTAEAWNANFMVNDGSFVSKIDTEEKIFIINDVQRHEQLIVRAKELPKRDFTEIEALKFHKRIFERQGLGKMKLEHNTMYNHTFAEMLDYVIQYVGERVPFSSDGSSALEDQLIVNVTRKNTDTGKEISCKAEYTFGQKGEDVYVYHRLLRPI